MFKEQMYKELRDELELYERARQDETEDSRIKKQEDAILCNYLRGEKEKDIRLAIRLHQVALMEAKKNRDEGKHTRELERYREDLLDFLEQNPKSVNDSKEKELLFTLLKVEGEKTVKEAVEDCRGNDRTFRGLDTLNEVGELILRLRNDSGRKDPYVALQEVYLDYKLGKQDKQAVYEKARELGANRKYRISKELKELLKSDSRSDGIANEEDLQGWDIGKIVEELSAAILVTQAKAFLYDAGYPLETKETVTSSNVERRQDRIMELVDLFWVKKGKGTLGTGSVSTGSRTIDLNSREFKEHCLAVYDKLQEEERDDVFLPLFIDNDTGAGLYILGAERIDHETMKKARRKWREAGKGDWDSFYCHFCYLYWEEILKEEYGAISVIFNTKAYGDDIESALKAYLSYQSGQKLSLEAFRDQNGEFPKGLDKRYGQYFEDFSDDDEENGVGAVEVTVEQWDLERAFSLENRPQYGQEFYELSDRCEQCYLKYRNDNNITDVKLRNDLMLAFYRCTIPEALMPLKPEEILKMMELYFKPAES